MTETEEEKVIRLEREAVMDEPISFDEFDELLAAAREDLGKVGQYSGLCPSCMGTGKIFKTQGKYSGFEHRKDEDHILFVTCMHGADDSEGLGF